MTNIAAKAGLAKEPVVEFEGRDTMSVIGRLDKQVDDVFITPLEQNRPQVNIDQNVNSDSDDPLESEPNQVKKKIIDDSLPVWLL